MNTCMNRGDKATRLGFGEGVLELAGLTDRLVVLGADITGSVGLARFAETFPERFFSFGIAEQNIAAVAAGLALSGKFPVFSTYSAFATMRAADQLRISVCYNNVNVIIGGAHSGISVGPDGATHQALEDIALMRALPNMTVVSPCDANQTKRAVLAAYQQVDGPVYIRFGREPVPNFSDSSALFKIGKAELLRSGSDIALVATGHMVWEAIQAAERLSADGIDASVVNIHTIKPLDIDLLVNVARSTGLVLTVEEHQIIGGLGSAVAEALSRNNPVPVKRLGMNDCFGESGTPSQLLEKYGMNARAIYRETVEMLKKYR